MLAPRVTAKRKAIGLAPTSVAALMAMGAIRTAVAVLLMNMVRSEVVKYMDRFKEIEDISQDEVESDMGITFISM